MLPPCQQAKLAKGAKDKEHLPSRSLMSASTSCGHAAQFAFGQQGANCGREQMQQMIVVYSITSSARPSSGSGKVSPSVLATLRLMMSWILVSCMTGKSAGFAPFRIRPV